MDIKKQEHLENLLGSLNVFFINAKTKGVIRNKELYLLDTMYYLINTCDVLTDTQRTDMIKLYYKLLNKFSNLLCKNTIKPSNYYTKSHSYTHDENVFTTSTNDKIYYWQEDSVSRTNTNVVDDVTNTNYLSDKSNDSLLVFSTGKDIDYTSTGRICFAIQDVPLTDNYRIYDILDNDITHAFTKTIVTSKNVILFISNNIYAHGMINFEIRKPI